MVSIILSGGLTHSTRAVLSRFVSLAITRLKREAIISEIRDSESEEAASNESNAAALATASAILASDMRGLIRVDSLDTVDIVNALQLNNQIFTIWIWIRASRIDQIETISLQRQVACVTASIKSALSSSGLRYRIKVVVEQCSVIEHPSKDRKAFMHILENFTPGDMVALPHYDRCARDDADLKAICTACREAKVALAVCDLSKPIVRPLELLEDGGGLWKSMDSSAAPADENLELALNFLRNGGYHQAFLRGSIAASQYYIERFSNSCNHTPEKHPHAVLEHLLNDPSRQLVFYTRISSGVVGDSSAVKLGLTPSSDAFVDNDDASNLTTASLGRQRTFLQELCGGRHADHSISLSSTSARFPPEGVAAAVDLNQIVVDIKSGAIKRRALVLCPIMDRLSRSPGYVRGIVGVCKEHDVELILALVDWKGLKCLKGTTSTFTANALKELAPPPEICSSADSFLSTCLPVMEGTQSSNKNPVICPVSLCRSEAALAWAEECEQEANNFCYGRVNGYQGKVIKGLQEIVDTASAQALAQAEDSPTGARGLTEPLLKLILLTALEVSSQYDRFTRRISSNPLDITLWNTSVPAWICSCNCQSVPGGDPFCRCRCKKCRAANLSLCKCARDRMATGINLSSRDVSTCSCDGSCPCLCDCCHGTVVPHQWNFGLSPAPLEDPLLEALALTGSSSDRSAICSRDGCTSTILARVVNQRHWQARVCSVDCYVRNCEASGMPVRRCSNSIETCKGVVDGQLGISMPSNQYGTRCEECGKSVRRGRASDGEPRTAAAASGSRKKQKSVLMSHFFS